ncbi:GrpB family protein [Metabacillus litoralis]|uniref:GrpB family protein n=1 Tax=Metabacillus TaxID=2675233 RepID=UPI001B90547A|nr:GrpB family protein [Metabacillus litoralis]MCM3160284.1 GrpB family protein [Metabacillus litoralis]MCM3408869.1 GrpB family protein [Metabacillus litoralis]UHA59482.1 GrpB family protein [Metabacillus litoralis]
MKISLSEYDPNWQQQFLLEKERLQTRLQFINPMIEHIGSTSIIGLSAKPIIDMMIGVREENQLEKVVDALAQSPYVYVSIYDKQLPFRRFFIVVKKAYADLYPHVLTTENFMEIPHQHRIAHIHTVPFESQWWEDHLLFRDFLTQSKEHLLEYENFKKELAQKEWTNGNEYAGAKAKFIQSILNEAKS